MNLLILVGIIVLIGLGGFFFLLMYSAGYWIYDDDCETWGIIIWIFTTILLLAVILIVVDVPLGGIIGDWWESIWLTEW